MDRSQGPRSWWPGVVLGIYWAAIFAATHWPQPPQLLSGTGTDKVAHLISYAALAFLLAWAVRRGPWRLTRTTQITLLAALAGYGIVDELSQPIVGRQAEVGDWLADVAGIAVGGLCFLLAAAAGRYLRAHRASNRRRHAGGNHSA